MNGELRRVAGVCAVVALAVVAAASCGRSTEVSTPGLFGPTATVAPQPHPPGTVSRPTKSIPPAGQVCAAISAPMLARVFAGSVPDGDDAFGGPGQTACLWKQGATELVVETFTNADSFDSVQADPSATWEPLAGVDAGIGAMVADSYAEDGKKVAVRLADGGLQLSLRPSADPVVLADLVGDIVRHAPDA